jgi:hypothetical protein
MHPNADCKVIESHDRWRSFVSKLRLCTSYHIINLWIANCRSLQLYVREWRHLTTAEDTSGTCWFDRTFRVRCCCRHRWYWRRVRRQLSAHCCRKNRRRTLHIKQKIHLQMIKLAAAKSSLVKKFHSKVMSIYPNTMLSSSSFCWLIFRPRLPIYRLRSLCCRISAVVI